MFHNLRIFLTVSIVVFCLSACKSDTDGLNYIPKDALGVFSINLKSLSQKIAWSALSDSRVLKELANSGKEKAFDINATGVNPFANIYAFGLPDQRLESKFKFLLVLPLKDKNKFEQYLNETFPLAKTVKENNKTFFVIDDYSCFSWDDHIAIGAFSSPSEYDLVNADELQVILKQDILKSFSLEKEQSLSNEKIMNDLQKESNDFSFWFNFESFTQAMPQDEMNPAGAILSNQKNLVANTFLTGGLNFKKGKIEIDGKYFYNSSSKKLAEIFTDVKYKEDLIDYIPGNQLNLLAHFQINPNGFAALIDSIGMMPLTKLALKETGLNSNQVFNLLEGDFLFTIVDFNFEDLSENLSDKMSGKSGTPFFQSAVTFFVRDKASADSILNQAVNSKLMTKSKSGTFHFGNYYLVMKDKYVVISQEEQTAVELAGSMVENTKWKLPAEIKNTPFGMFIDVKNTTRDFISFMPNSEEGIRVLKLIDNITLSGGKVNGPYSDYHINISLQNKEENSLLQLIHLKDLVP